MAGGAAVCGCRCCGPPMLDSSIPIPGSCTPVPGGCEPMPCSWNPPVDPWRPEVLASSTLACVSRPFNFLSGGCLASSSSSATFSSSAGSWGATPLPLGGIRLRLGAIRSKLASGCPGLAGHNIEARVAASLRQVVEVRRTQGGVLRIGKQQSVVGLWSKGNWLTARHLPSLPTSSTDIPVIRW